MSDQQGLTIITRVRPGQAPALRRLLEEISSDDRESSPVIAFGRLTRVHFLRWFLLDAPPGPDGAGGEPSLVFSSCFDGSARKHLDELIAIGGPAVARLYAHCEGFPEEPEAAAVRGYLERHRVPIDTLYVGTRGFTVERIRREAALHDALQRHLDTGMTAELLRSRDPMAIRGELQRFVRAREDLAWARTAPPPRRRVPPRRRDLIVLAALGLLGTAVLVLSWLSATAAALALAALLAVALVAAWTLARKEATDPEDDASLDVHHVRTLARDEDRIVQNQLSNVTTVKPGLFRQALLRAVLWTIDVAGRYVYTDGRLGGIPSIHYARWIVIDRGRRLLFLSNFDGSWESYLGDFIDKAASGLTAVWSNTEGFPRTRWLTGGGARDEQRFKAYSRRSQVPTQLWYSAYKSLTVLDILRNAALREGLFDERDEAATNEWLALL